MKSLPVLVAVFGVLALAFQNASAATDSSSFLVSLRIAAPCDVAAVGPGRGGVTVSCESPSTPYRLELEARAVEPQAREVRDAESGYVRATLTF